MDIATSVYQLALKDVAQIYKESLDGVLLRSDMTSEEYRASIRKNIRVNLREAVVRKRKELSRALLAAETNEIPIIRKEYRLALARYKAYKEFFASGLN